MQSCFSVFLSRVLGLLANLTSLASSPSGSDVAAAVAAPLDDGRPGRSEAQHAPNHSTGQLLPVPRTAVGRLHHAGHSHHDRRYTAAAAHGVSVLFSACREGSVGDALCT